MCMMSVVMEHKYDSWLERYYRDGQPRTSVEPITTTEVNDFRSLVDRAREYDRKTNQPDCEMDEKREKLKKLAGELGVAIEFV